MLEQVEKSKILIVEDSEANVLILKSLLSTQGYILDVAVDGEAALEAVHRFAPDLILLDLQMPKLDGYEVTKILKEDRHTRFIPIIIITALNELNSKIRGIELGADEYLMKPFNKFELFARVSTLIRFKKMNDNLESSENVLFSLARAIEAKDKYTEGHSERVSIYSVRLARKIRIKESEIEIIRKGALLHDIGKIGIPESILCKPAPLDNDEYLVMREHPKIGSKITEPLRNAKMITNMVRFHHEHFDGRGHPDGLIGEKIPLEARIVSVVDAYDAIVTTRPYRKGSPKTVAFDVLRNGSGKQWDPYLVEMFIEMICDWEEEKKQSRQTKLYEVRDEIIEDELLSDLRD